MRIAILGTGCHNCLRLELLVADVLKEMGVTDAKITRIDDERSITHWMSLDAVPGLVINDHLVSEGRLPDRATLAAWLSQARAAETKG